MGRTGLPRAKLRTIIREQGAMLADLGTRLAACADLIEELAPRVELTADENAADVTRSLAAARHVASLAREHVDHIRDADL